MARTENGVDVGVGLRPGVPAEGLLHDEFPLVPVPTSPPETSRWEGRGYGLGQGLGQ